jgi:uncharacterized metal-binding protein YceD (DUF177 family)
MSKSMKPAARLAPKPATKPATARTRKSVMTPEAVGPLSRWIDVMNLPPQGSETRVVATAEECAALAKDFKLPAIHSLAADYKLTASAKGVHVEGRVTAAITQICVVTLEPFDSTIEEDVQVDFAEPSGMPPEPPTEMHEYEPPDEILNGHIDLGAITAEFLVLGLDPYPRKPGVDFEYRDEGDAKDSPFAALEKLKRE